MQATIRTASDTNAPVWLYRFQHASHPWTLSIATHAEPGSNKLSLGGFRIAPKERSDAPGFDPDREAIELAIGMEEKVYWSRILNIGGPLARRDMKRIVGGKCVLKPTPDARIGQPEDFDLLDWAIECFRAFEKQSGVCLTTGQDLGHGIMSDGETQSLDYLSRRFAGSVDADTSKPTGEGNFFALEGMLRGVGISLEDATVGLVGVGNIGLHIFERLMPKGTRMIAVEAREDRRARIESAGHRAFAPAQKAELLRQPIDALVVNASGGSLDSAAVDLIVGNPRLRVICGSENLAMPNHADADRLRAARKSYCPTELGGMMGYLTAVEEYLAHVDDKPFDVHTLFDSAARLETATYAATRRQIDRDYSISFEDAVREVATTL